MFVIFYCIAELYRFFPFIPFYSNILIIQMIVLNKIRTGFAVVLYFLYFLYLYKWSYNVLFSKHFSYNSYIFEKFKILFNKTDFNQKKHVLLYILLLNFQKRMTANDSICIFYHRSSYLLLELTLFYLNCFIEDDYLADFVWNFIKDYVIFACKSNTYFP